MNTDSIKLYKIICTSGLGEKLHLVNMGNTSRNYLLKLLWFICENMTYLSKNMQNNAENIIMHRKTEKTYKFMIFLKSV